MPQSYVFPSQKKIASKRKLAETMQERGMDYSPVQSWTQGAARLANAMIGGYGQYQADQIEEERQGALADAIKNNMPMSEMQRLGLGSGDMDIEDVISQNLKQQDMAADAERARRMGLQPRAYMKDGVLHMAQINSEGGAEDLPAPDGGSWLDSYTPKDLGTEMRPFGRHTGWGQPGAGAAVEGVEGEVLPPLGPAAGPATAPSGGMPIDVQGKARQAEAGQLQAKAQAALPNVLSRGQEALDAIKRVRGHAGRNWGTGPVAGRVGAIAGDQAAFVKEFETTMAKNYLTSYDLLRGAGAITEKEGEVATKAFSALSRVVEPEEFDLQLNILEGVISRGMENAKAIAAGTYVPELNITTPRGGETKRFRYDAEGNQLP